MKKYLIGELAKAMGVSHDYIKHYEKNGVIQCERDEDSGYRYFSFGDAGKIADAKKYRNIGFTVNEVKDFLWNYDLNKTLELFRQKRDSASKDVFRLQRHIDYLEEVLKYFPSGKFINDKWYIIEQDEFYFFPHTKEKTFYLNEIDSIRVQKWIDEQPLTHKTIYLPLKNNDFDRNEYLYGFWADKNIVETLKLDIEKPVIRVKSSRCFVYYFTSMKDNNRDNNSVEFKPSIIDYLTKPLSVIKQFDLEPCNFAAYCKLLHRSNNNEDHVYYWALYVPIL